MSNNKIIDLNFENGLYLTCVSLYKDKDCVKIYKAGHIMGYMPKKFLLEDCGGRWYNVAVLESVLSQD